jgi:hypothetical protein
MMVGRAFCSKGLARGGRRCNWDTEVVLRVGEIFGTVKSTLTIAETMTQVSERGRSISCWR